MQTSKPVLILLVVQTALIFFLIIRVYGVEARTGELAADIATISIDKKLESRDLNPASLASNGISSSDALSAEETRLIVREELELLSDRLMKGIENRRSAKFLSAGPVRTEETQRIKQEVADQIHNLTVQGTASHKEMAALELLIARLPPGEREQALRTLFRTINQGKIDTRF